MKKYKNIKLLSWIFVGVGIFAITFYFLFQREVEEFSISHIHGLHYNEEERKVIVAAHDGLKEYSNNKWSNIDTMRNDYMGFAATDDGFYSSGHPGQGYDLKNPLGIVRSTDEGKTLDILDLHGEVDFHYMTVGYHTKDIYVFTTESNKKMPTSGFYYSTDQTQSWNSMSLNGVAGTPTSMAASPHESGVISIGTTEGVFISKDYGETFQSLTFDAQISAITMTQNQILYANFTKGTLYAYNRTSKKDVLINSPQNKNDPILYISSPSKDSSTIVIATEKGSIFLTTNYGETWNEILTEGQSK